MVIINRIFKPLIIIENFKILVGEILLTLFSIMIDLEIRTVFCIDNKKKKEKENQLIRRLFSQVIIVISPPKVCRRLIDNLIYLIKLSEWKGVAIEIIEGQILMIMEIKTVIKLQVMNLLASNPKERCKAFNMKPQYTTILLNH